MHSQESNNRSFIGPFWISSPPRKRVYRSTFSATSFVVRATSWRQQCHWVGEQPGLETCVVDEGKQRFADRAMEMKIDGCELASCLYYPHQIGLGLCCGGNLIIWAVKFILSSELSNSSFYTSPQYNPPYYGFVLQFHAYPDFEHFILWSRNFPSQLPSKLSRSNTLLLQSLGHSSEFALHY